MQSRAYPSPETHMSQGKTAAESRGMDTPEQPTASCVIGVISDTHAHTHPGLKEAFAGVELIVHAGDIGSPGVMTGLRAIAPVLAVRGNVDMAPWAREFSATETAIVHGVSIHVLHNLARLDLDPAAAGVDVVVYGHTHQALVQRHKGVLFVNPGNLQRPPASVALLHVLHGSVRAEIVGL